MGTELVAGTQTVRPHTLEKTLGLFLAKDLCATSSIYLNISISPCFACTFDASLRVIFPPVLAQL